VGGFHGLEKADHPRLDMDSHPPDRRRIPFLFSEPNLAQRIAGLLLPGVCLLFLAVKYGGVGGGDVKLTAALGYCFGLNALAAILFFALPPACIYTAMTRQRSVPLAVFLCIGFFMYAGVLFIYGLTF